MLRLRIWWSQRAFDSARRALARTLLKDVRALLSEVACA